MTREQWTRSKKYGRVAPLPSKASFFQDRDTKCSSDTHVPNTLSALLPPYNWGLGFHQLFHLHALPFSLTVILILDISLETQLYISIMIWLGSSENLSYSIKRFSDSFACHQLELQLTKACYQSNIEILFV